MSIHTITLSDITTSTGKHICPYMAKGDQHLHRKTSHKLPNQNKIGKKYWRIWETWVKDTFCQTNTELKQPLKDWIEGAVPSQQWERFADHNTGNLIQITGHGDTQQCREHKVVPTKNTAYTTKD